MNAILTRSDNHGPLAVVNTTTADLALAAHAVAERALVFSDAATRAYERGDHAQGDRDLATAEQMQAIARTLWPSDSDHSPVASFAVAQARRLRAVPDSLVPA